MLADGIDYTPATFIAGEIERCGPHDLVDVTTPPGAAFAKLAVAASETAKSSANSMARDHRLLFITSGQHRALLRNRR